MADEFARDFLRGWAEIVRRWEALPFWEQEAIKIIGLVAIVLLTIMILGDIYRGEIQNRFFKVKPVAYPGANPSGDKELIWVPKDLTSQNVDQIKSGASFYLCYRDELGRDRRKRLHTFVVRFKVRYARFKATLAAELAADHRPEVMEESDGTPSDTPRAEIVALDRSRASLIMRERKAFFTQLEVRANNMRNSRLLRWARMKRSADIQDPKTHGIEVKFHFPINPFFLLYRHPDRDLRSTAWLTVLTSLFALLMQILFGYTNP